MVERPAPIAAPNFAIPAAATAACKRVNIVVIF